MLLLLSTYLPQWCLFQCIYLPDAHFPKFQVPTIVAHFATDTAHMSLVVKKKTNLDLQGEAPGCVSLSFQTITSSGRDVTIFKGAQKQAITPQLPPFIALSHSQFTQCQGTYNF